MYSLKEVANIPFRVRGSLMFSGLVLGRVPRWILDVFFVLWDVILSGFREHSGSSFRTRGAFFIVA